MTNSTTDTNRGVSVFTYSRVLSSAVAIVVLSISGCANQTMSDLNTQALGNSQPGQSVDSSRDINRWPQLSSAVVLNPVIESKIDALLASMSIEEKVGQMTQPELRSITPEEVKRYHIGSVLNGGGSFPGGNKNAQASDWVALADGFYQASMDDSDGFNTIPIMWGTDAVHGVNNVYGATIFPHNIGLGATANESLLKEIGEVTARETRVIGVDWSFAPAVSVVQDNRWGRTYEGYSESPELVERLSGPLVEGLQGELNEGWLGKEHVIATAKHFIGDGGTHKGKDQGNTLVSEQELIDVHLAGYLSALEAGVQTIMASFNSWQGDKAHGHQYLLTDVLKGRLGFDGAVVGDWNGHGQVPGCTNDNCPQAINAGVDIIMVPEQWKSFIANTVRQVHTGEITEERINDAVRRILRVKYRAGLFDAPPPSKRLFSKEQSLLGAKEHRAVARRAARESLVLLKNNNQLLPLHPKKNILVTGDGADNIGKQSGGWTLSWQGTGNTNNDFPNGESIYSGIKNTVHQGGGKVHLVESEEILSASSTEELFSDHQNGVPDVAIVVFGEGPYAEGQGDLKGLEYQAGEHSDLTLLQHLKALNIPVVSVFLSGRPMWVNAELNASEAFVAAWWPGTEGGAVADVLFSDTQGEIQFNFHGTLPYRWPSEANPYDSFQGGSEKSDATLFALGYGLDYQRQLEPQGLFAKALHENNLSEEGVQIGGIDSSDLVLFAGRATAPWALHIGSGEETLLAESASHELEGIRLRTIDRIIQEDARQVEWFAQENAQSSWVGFIADTPQSLLKDGAQPDQLLFELKRSGVAIDKIELIVTSVNDDEKNVEQSVNLVDYLASVTQDEWHQLKIPVTALSEVSWSAVSEIKISGIQTEGESAALSFSQIIVDYE
ncbi:glycoside hydrolase family 3 protein [Marinibactrum halimedae]|uniref:Glucan 1,4-beta-glucosidase n=1 Tax=Marinibactrum halimedae TaxID=1444977 RepID=A0AA37T1M1_9GAMM|nr:glycoside hydrolase family 3 N-terminal domain-containing protein [Marinibactrum halimedae]MCD9458791.1 glycoside hydrolase family 3 C-terminal domain-containing protein [Marinibactrum halimedae]GLS25350.1 glucan 1,4-beta-glucosidase [Marinibactrum halimedae]